MLSDEDENLNERNIEFQWRIDEYKEERITIKLNFNNSLSISPYKEEDMIMFQIKDPEVNIPLYFTSIDGY